MSDIASESERSYPVLAARSSTVEFFGEPMKHLRMSRLHQSDEPWIPEKGSTEWLKREPSSKPMKQHWIDSDCTRVGYEKWGANARDNVLDGYSFDKTPDDEKCLYCLRQFNNA